MQNPHPPPPQQPPSSSFSSSPLFSTSALKEPKTTLSIVLATSLFSLLFFLALSSSPSSSPPSRRPDPFLFPSRVASVAGDSDPAAPPAVAYLLSGSNGDSGQILRLLFASYHPRNHYLLHLDRFASSAERDRLAVNVQSVPVFQAAQNVDVIGKADFVYPKGSSSLAFTLHGASMLLRLKPNWDWFVSLNAGDYPLVTQDGDVLTSFVKHRGYGSVLENISANCNAAFRSKKLKPIIVDPGLYLAEKTAMFYASQKRELPNAYRLFTGSSFAILSRDFVEFCIMGTDNLPRTLLMYFSNTPSSLSNYFPTILCNSRQFNRTIINHELKYANFDKPSSEEPRQVTSDDFDAMIQSGAAFAARFNSNDPLLDRIDKEILGRERGYVLPGGWCLGESGNNTCSVWGDADILRPGSGARRLEKLLVELLSNSTTVSNRCIFE